MLSLFKTLIVSLGVSLVVAFGVTQHQAQVFDYTQVRAASYKIYNLNDENGTGVMIAPKRMLTAAHVAKQQSNETPLYVDGNPIKVLKIDDKFDLALLEVDLLCPCVPVAKDLPSIDFKVITVGYPLGNLIKAQILTVGAIQGFIPEEYRIMATVAGVPGNSGGGLFGFTKQGWQLFGVVVENAGMYTGFYPVLVQYMTRSVDTKSINEFLKDADVGPTTVYF